MQSPAEILNKIDFSVQTTSFFYHIATKKNEKPHLERRLIPRVEDKKIAAILNFSRYGPRRGCPCALRVNYTYKVSLQVERYVSGQPLPCKLLALQYVQVYT